jgi:uncharacterized Tic20 family protein
MEPGRHSARLAVTGHLSAAVAVIAAAVVAGGLEPWTGMVAFLGPLLVLAAAARDPFARPHAVAALRFNLSVALYLGLIIGCLQLVTASPYLLQAVPFLLFLNMVVAFNWLVFMAIGAQRAATGQLFTYPMTLPWPSPFPLLPERRA